MCFCFSCLSVLRNSITDLREGVDCLPQASKSRSSFRIRKTGLFITCLLSSGIYCSLDEPICNNYSDLLQCLQGEDYTSHCLHPEIVQIMFNSTFVKDPQAGSQPSTYTFVLPHVQQSKSCKAVTVLTKKLLQDALEGIEPGRKLVFGFVKPDVSIQELRRLLPKLPDRQLFETYPTYNTCAVVGNSENLLKNKYGSEIDGHDVVIRNNNAPIHGFQKYVGSKTTFRFVNNMGQQFLDNSINILKNHIKTSDIRKWTANQTLFLLSRDRGSFFHGLRYALSGKSTIPLPVGGTGSDALRFALKVCKKVEAYGYTISNVKTYGHYYSKTFSRAINDTHHFQETRALYIFLNCSGYVIFR